MSREGHKATERYKQIAAKMLMTPIQQTTIPNATSAVNDPAWTLQGHTQGPAVDIHLMQAAPSLYAALSALLTINEEINHVFYVKGTSVAMRTVMQGQKAFLQQARAALSLARGEQPVATTAQLGVSTPKGGAL